MIDLGWAAGFLPLIVAGFGVGFLVGLTGVGGGALMTPLLISSFGVTPQIAVGTDLLYASITKTAGSWRHHVVGSRRMADRLPPRGGKHPGLAHPACRHRLHPAQHCGARPLDPHGSRRGVAAERPRPRSLSYSRQDTRAGSRRKGPAAPDVTVLFGVALGLLVTLTSVGAGAIGVSVLAALYPHLPAKRIVGSDIAHAVPLTLVGGLGHLGLGHVDLALLGVLLIGSIPGILLGARLAGVAPDWILRPVLGIMLCYAAWVLFNK